MLLSEIDNQITEYKEVITGLKALLFNKLSTNAPSHDVPGAHCAEGIMQFMPAPGSLPHR